MRKTNESESARNQLPRAVTAYPPSPPAPPPLAVAAPAGWGRATAGTKARAKPKVIVPLATVIAAPERWPGPPGSHGGYEGHQHDGNQDEAHRVTPLAPELVERLGGQ